MIVDPSKPMELSDGTPVMFVRVDCDGDIVVNLPVGTSKRLGLTGADEGRVFHVSGRNWGGEVRLTLRNVHPARTGIEHVERMEALLRMMAAETSRLDGPWIREARAIIAAIDGPKTDGEWVREIILEHCPVLMARYDIDVRSAILAGIAKGRELERGAR